MKIAPANLKAYKYDAAVAAFIDSFWLENIRSPTLREITAGVNSPSTFTISCAVKRIAKARGDFLFKDGSARGIVPRWVQEAVQGADVQGNKR